MTIFETNITQKKMKVQIENEQLKIGENSLEYYPYYFSIWKDKDEFDHRPTVKNVLTQWATALTALCSGLYPAVYLPYYLDDQSCQYLKAELEGEDIVFSDLLVRDDGYAMDLDDLSDRMYSEPDIVKSWIDRYRKEHNSEPKFFGRYNAKEIIQALKDAELSDS